MVKLVGLLAGVILVSLTGCASHPTVPVCEPVEVRVPVTVPIQLPAITRPVLKSHLAEPTVDARTKAMQHDFIIMKSYALELEMIIDAIRSQHTR
jgi:type IV pilus biogenesis protein CpaD/CtpE